jgi:uncharacterized protein YyaL (SSP411 family)
MNQAYSKACATLGDDHYRQVALRNMAFLLKQFKAAGNSIALHHTYKNGQAKYPAFLDDYACLVQALLQLQEITGNNDWLLTAKTLTEHVLDNFGESDTGFFYFTPTGQPDIIVRKKEVYDGAVPSGNAVMAINLYCLGILFDLPNWRERSVKMCTLLQQTVSRYPGSFGLWATIMQTLCYGLPEIAIIGGNFAVLRTDVLRRFLPIHVLQSAPTEPSDRNFPLLSHKPYSAVAAQIFLCQEYSCQQPVNEVDALMQIMENV